MLAPVVRKKATKYNREERIIICTLSLSLFFSFLSFSLSYGRRRRGRRRTNAVVTARRRPSRRRRAPAALSSEMPLSQPVEIAYGFATPAHVASMLFGFGVQSRSSQFHTHLLSVAHDEEESCMLHMYQFFSMSAKNALVGNAASYAASVGTHVGSPFEDKTSQFESSAQLVSLVALAHVIKSTCVASLPPNVTANDLNVTDKLVEQEVPS
tara:strand:- start:303 stop:935 length:633 start_codon:yes stop_codon:yes gene_type:complete